MLGCRRTKTIKALGLTILMFGCDNSVDTPITSLPTPTTPTPSPAPTVAASVLSGVVSEITGAGRIALEGATVHLLTCGAENCPPALTAGLEVKTGKDGGYRIAGVYNGNLNYLWVRNAVYDMADPMPVGTCPDGCDRVVAVNGDTRLDIDLVRR
jgi:hypothetical protein